MSHSKSTHRKPLSPPRSPPLSDGAEDRAPPPRPTVEDDDDEDDYNASSHSSPPTSVDADPKDEPFSTSPLPSRRTSLSSADARSAAAPDGRGDQYRLPSLTLSQFSDPRSDADHEDDFAFPHQHESPLDDPESQWESDAPPPISGAKQQHQHQPQQRRKAATPTSAAAKPYPRPGHRPSTSLARSHLQPQTASRRSTHFYSSRASSASYSEVVPSEKKAPLVLLHISLLFLPGAEEAILRKITPTVLERGLLVEHPRGDYQLLEELIIDSLSLDDALAPAGQDGGEHEQDEWEASLGVRRVRAKTQWEIRVYACNGLMTAGAWKRVWSEMERVDVEVGPKGWRGKKTDELIRGFVRSGGRYGSRDGGLGRGKHGSLTLFNAVLPVADLKWWVGVAGVAMLMIAASFFGLFWTLGLGGGRGGGGGGVQNQLTYSSIAASIENASALPDAAVVEPVEVLVVDAEPVKSVEVLAADAEPAKPVEVLVADAEPVKSVSDCGEEASPTTTAATTTAAATTALAAESESTDACGRATEVAEVESDVEAGNDDAASESDVEELAGDFNSPESPTEGEEGAQETAIPLDKTPQLDETTDPATFVALSEATEEPVAPVLLSFDDADGAGSGPEGWWNNWKAGL